VHLILLILNALFLNTYNSVNPGLLLQLMQNVMTNWYSCNYQPWLYYDTYR